MHLFRADASLHTFVCGAPATVSSNEKAYPALRYRLHLARAEKSQQDAKERSLRCDRTKVSFTRAGGWFKHAVSPYSRRIARLWIFRKDLSRAANSCGARTLA